MIFTVLPVSPEGDEHVYSTESETKLYDDSGRHDHTEEDCGKMCLRYKVKFYVGTISFDVLEKKWKNFNRI